MTDPTPAEAVIYEVEVLEWSYKVHTTRSIRQNKRIRFKAKNI
jgi:hypothetical protein